MRLTLGTRGSQLALTQSGQVADALRALGHEVELVTIRSEGDVTTGSLIDSGGLGLFATALRRAVLDGAVDFAVHSFKDLPTAAVPGLVVAAVPARAASSDALCARDGLTLADLPPGSRVGTGSPRRAAQLRERRPDLVVVEIRGNVGTRLARVHGDGTAAGDLDAVVLAEAGLSRLGRLDAVTDVLDLLPAPGQGALAVECRADDDVARAALAALDDPATRVAVTAERAIPAALDAGCAAPLGAHATVADGRITLVASVLAADGRAAVTVTATSEAGADPDVFGRSVAASLLADGAAAVTPLGAARLSQLRDFHDEQSLWSSSTREVLVGRRVLLPRADGPLADAVRAAGAHVDAVPFTHTRVLPFALDGHFDWLVLTSPTAVRVLVDAGVDLTSLAARIAAVGASTAAAVRAAGGEVALTPDGRFDADSLLAALPAGPASALVPGSALSSPHLADGLRARGWNVHVVATYTTETKAELPPEIHGWDAYDAVVITAGSIARAVVELLGHPDTVRVVAFGAPSATAARTLGLHLAAVAATQDGPGLVAALTEAFA